MFQALHIFVKDTKKLWPEILASLAIAAAFVWVYPYQWMDALPDASHSPLDLGRLQILATVATGLLPIAWAILIARAVHAENLIGARLFWITRPYEWKKLLGAKLLFIGAYVYLPFLAAQMALLARAGFEPFHYMAGLLFNLLLVTGILILPMLALAAVTSSLLRMILTLLAIAVIIIVIAFFAAGRDSAPSVSIPFSDRFSIPLVFGLAGSAVLSQYATRKLWLARTLLISLPFAIAVIAINPFDIRMLQHFYPAINHLPGAAELRFASSKNFDVMVWPGAKGRPEIEIPVRLSGLPADLVFNPDDVQLSIDCPDGSHWSSRWQPVYNTHLDVESNSRLIGITGDSKFLDRVQGRPVTLRLQLAFTQLQAGKTMLLQTPDPGEHLLAEWGLCSYFMEAKDASWELRCKLPLRQPPLMRIEPGQFPDSCTIRASDWLGTLDRDPAEFGLTSVWTTTASVGTAPPRKGAQDACKAAGLRLTSYTLVRRFRYLLIIPDVKLPAASKPNYSLNPDSVPE